MCSLSVSVEVQFGHEVAPNVFDFTWVKLDTELLLVLCGDLSNTRDVCSDIIANSHTDVFAV